MDSFSQELFQGSFFDKFAHSLDVFEISWIEAIRIVYDEILVFG
jgi:hypothetical protein